MNKVLAIILSVFLLFSLSACGGGSYHKATDGDLTVSLPEKEESKIETTVSDVVGKWNLVSITKKGETQNYENSYYDFRESGTIKIKIGRQTDTGKYTVKDDNIIITNGRASNKIAFVLKDNTLTLTTSGGDVHILTKITETES